MLDRQIVKASADGVDIFERKFAVMRPVRQKNEHALLHRIDP